MRKPYSKEDLECTTQKAFELQILTFNVKINANFKADRLSNMALQIPNNIPENTKNPLYVGSCKENFESSKKWNSAM